jgi:hypothetical protein
LRVLQAFTAPPRPSARGRSAAAIALALATVLLALGGCAAKGRAADQATVVAHPITLDEDAAAAELGPLRLEAAFVLGSADARFGGLSGLWLAPDGTTMLAASDRGTLWRARLVHREGGQLAGLADWQAIEPGGAPGDPAGRFERDAEALAPDGAGGLVIAYEGAHRLRRLALGALEAAATPLPALPGLEEPGNAGIEALAPLPDGALLALAEGKLTASGDLAGWYVEGARARPLSYAASDGFAPTGADRLDDMIFVVERRFSLLGGFATRIVALPAAEVHPQARLVPRPVALLRPPLVGENFEAIAARRGPDGRVLLYLLADDNFIALQRTLVLQLSLAAAWPKAQPRDPPDAGAGS